MAVLLKSVRARLTAWYSFWLCVPLVAFAVLSYLSFSRALTERTDEFLDDALTVFENELMVERRQIPDVEEALRTTVHEVRFRDLDIMVMTGGWRLVAGSSSETGNRSGPVESTKAMGDGRVLETLQEMEAGGVSVSTLPTPGGGLRIRLQSLDLGEDRFTIAGVYPLASVENTLRRIRRLAFVTIPLLLLIAGVGGWFLARRSFRPMTAMASRAAEISATTLHERLPVVAEDELGALARVLNNLLDRLEESFERQRRFVADASHELRSPTAILRSEAEITLSRPHRTEEEYRDALAIMRDAARRLGRVVDDLFLLARVDGGQAVMNTEPLYLEDVVRDTVRVAGPLAEQKGVVLEVASTVEAPFRGDPDLLGRVLLNLLANGIKHTPSGGTIEVSLEAGDGQFLVRVVDPGPGIEKEVQSRIFERFFQVDSARTRDGNTLTSGAGLGLAIGRSIAQMHGGSLELAESKPGRTEFVLTLPSTV